MATIKEMADEAYKAITGQLVVCNECYQQGASAALEEIEKFADYTWGAKSLNTISLKKKIKELKGD